jgi:alcohol dehydrogenase (cytochrome c)
MHRRWVIAPFAVAFFWVFIASGAPACAVHPGASVDWPFYNNDINNDIAANRYVALDQISTSNVSGLHVLCTATLGTQLRFESGPIVVAGTMYVTTSNQTIALNAATCGVLWTNTYVLPPKVAHTNRGIAYAGDQLFRGFADGHVIAINAATGATVWNQKIVAAGSLEFIAAAPIVWHTSVIIGTANGEYGQMCHVAALNTATGALVWTQQTVPNLGSPNAKTWQGAARIAGGATWSSFTIDPATGRLYVPVGNPGPDFDVRKRVGRNLFTNSVLEFNALTGKFYRAIQVIPQDDHDWDQAAAPAVVKLGTTKIALIAGKEGYLRSIDLATFAQVWQTAVTTIENANAPIVPGGTHYCPAGAVHWNGPAYSPATGLAYVNAADICTTVDLAATPQPYVPGQPWLGSTNGNGIHDPAISGWLSAINAATGKTQWNYHSALPLVAGVTPTAGGLVLTADMSGKVLAFDATAGTLLASVPTGMPVGGGVISYAVSGTQYVAVAAGLNAPDYGSGQTSSSIVVLGL